MDELTQFDLSVDSEVVIRSSFPVHVPFEIFTPEINTASETEFQNNNTKKELVEKAVLKQITFQLKSPSGGNFNFLNSIELYIQAEGLAERKIAWKQPVPENTNTFTCDIAGEDLKDYIRKDKFKIKVVTRTDQLITTDHVIQINTVLFIDAKILGL
ncbi:MAG: hypothetical protein N2747_01535 [Chitinophagaceae bacterium]|nr:hypothetical protein [Chitinophagaceae bacterium]